MPRKQPAAGKRSPGRSGNPAKRASANRPGGATGARGNQGRPNRGRSNKAPNQGRSLPGGTSFFTPGASATRIKVERASAPLLVMFHRLPRVVFGALPLLLLVLGAFLPVPIALVSLALALLLLSWLAYLSWPRIEGVQKVMRLLVPLLVVAIAILRITRG